MLKRQPKFLGCLFLLFSQSNKTLIMKIVFPFLLLLICTTNINCQPNNLLLDKKLIADISHTPIYPMITEQKDGITKWKKEYEYIDSIYIFRINYLSDGLKVNGYLVTPKKDGDYPCLIYNRGGNREFGALKIAQAVFMMGKLANEGYVVIASNYRGNGGGEGQEEFGGEDLNDVLILPEVLAEIENADTSIIGMYGGSRGGMMTYMALPKMNNIKAAAVIGAPSDKFAGNKDRPEFEDMFLEIIPNYATNREEELKKRSTVFWADQFSKDVPILIMHGTSDWRVKPSQSLKLALEFDKYRIPYRLIMYEGADHGIREHRSEVFAELISWFDRFLKNNETVPNMAYHGR